MELRVQVYRVPVQPTHLLQPITCPLVGDTVHLFKFYFKQSLRDRLDLVRFKITKGFIK